MYLKKNVNIIHIFILILFMIFIPLYEFDFFNRDFSIYNSFLSDEFSIFAVIKAIQEQGLSAIFFINRWGAPEIAAEIANPSIDILMTLWIYLIGFFISDTATVYYIYIIITFILCALCMYLFLGQIGIVSSLNLIISALFALTPYHFLRYGHTALIGYYTIPLCMLILYHIFQPEQATSIRAKIALGMCAVVIGLGSPYYFFYCLMLFTLAYLIIFIKDRHPLKNICFKNIWNILYLFFIMCISFVCCQLPRIFYLALNNSFNNPVSRKPYESEIYGLKIIQLFLPASYHNNAFARNLSLAYSSSGASINENVTASLGVIGALGLIFLSGLFLKNFIMRKRPFGFIDYLAIADLSLILIGTVGGIGTIFNYLITPQFRCYNRISIVIVCISLAGFALVLNNILLSMKKRAVFVLASIFIIGIYDQIPFAPLYKFDNTNKNIQIHLQEFFSKIEDDLEDGDMVYQLPFMTFPENGPVNHIGDYAHFKGYLFTNTIRWSYGGIKGINIGAERLNLDDGMSERFLKGLTEAGFSGIYIDTNGYEDSGREIIQYYNDKGLSPIISADGSLYFYNIKNITIDEQLAEYESIPGFTFIKRIANTLDIRIENATCAIYAQMLKSDPKIISSILYKWFATSGIDQFSNREYINYLYRIILNRNAADIEISNWVSMLKTGSSRENIIYSFIISNEFAQQLN